MVSRSFLLVLTCLTVQKGASQSVSDICSRYQTQPIPAKDITEYKETGNRCPKPAVILTLKDGRQVCADPQEKWVKNNMNNNDQRLSNSRNKPEATSHPTQQDDSEELEPVKPVLTTSDNIEQHDNPVSTASPSRNEPVTTEQVSTSSASQDLGMDTSAESGKTDSPVTLIMRMVEVTEKRMFCLCMGSEIQSLSFHIIGQKIRINPEIQNFHYIIASQGQGNTSRKCSPCLSSICYHGAKKYLVSHQLCMFSNLKR
ncbi:fractalkine-like isoform X2 [Tachysurus fulvidraco]|uniref:fractalkine-like isoform X2 n=1 Tax=Tachysurus fulvidraco TaxID=1234273 RepID=UPI001FEE6774|nr:fractalkine-like isoform X2 [Tachysurus fulvidraco]